MCREAISVLMSLDLTTSIHRKENGIYIDVMAIVVKDDGQEVYPLLVFHN